MLVHRHGFVDAEIAAAKCNWKRILLQNVTVAVTNRQLSSGAFDGDVEQLRCEANTLRILFRSDRNAAMARIFEYCPGGILRKLLCAGDADAQNIIAKRGDLKMSRSLADVDRFRSAMEWRP
jgi:hypothetical protein